MFNVKQCGGSALVCAAAMSLTAPAEAATALLVPAYFSPVDHADEWARLTTAAARADVTAIFNPDSGPGTALDPTYTSVVGAFRAAGGTAIAYVSTRQSPGGPLRSLSAVTAEVDRYRSFYDFDGIFVDEMTNENEPDQIAFYADLFDYIKAQDATYTVVGNPGTSVPEAYSAVADVLVTVEQFGVNYASINPRRWTQDRPASGFANILHETDEADLAATLALAAERNVGYVYVTDDGADGNPYDSLPSYFEAEVDAVAVPEPAGLAALAVMAAVTQRRRRAV